MERYQQGLLVVLSGPSGVGKDSIIQVLRRQSPDIYFAVTATTRPPRAGEVPGKSYRFVSSEEYAAMLDRDELLAPAKVHGHWYGAPLSEIRGPLSAGWTVLLKIDVQGAIQVRRRLPQVVFVFVSPPSWDKLVERLVSRHTESPEELQRRLRDARFEMEQMPSYDYVVVNHEDNLREAAEGVACIITAERLRTHRQRIDLGDR